MAKNFMVHVTVDEKEWALYARTYEVADRAYDRVMKIIQRLAAEHGLPPLLTVSMSSMQGECFTYHYAEAFNGKWMVNKKNWEWNDWLDW